MPYCVTDPQTGWQLCGIAVDPVSVGQPIVAGCTLSSTSPGDAVYAGIVTDVHGAVVLVIAPSLWYTPGAVDSGATLEYLGTTWPPGSGSPVPADGNTWLPFLTDDVPDTLAGQGLLVFLGPYGLFQGVKVGDYYPQYRAGDQALVAAVTVGGTGSASTTPPSQPSSAGGLAWGSVYASPGQAAPGDTVTITAYVQNLGSGPAGANVVGADSLGRTLGPAYTGTIAAGDSAPVTFSMLAPSAAAGTTVSVALAIEGFPGAGTATVSYAVSLPSGSTSPPSSSGSSSGSGQPAGAPDFGILSATASPGTVYPGQPVTVVVTVANGGTGAGQEAIVGHDSLGRQWGPTSTRTIQAGGQTTWTMTSSATPASAAGQIITIALSLVSGSGTYTLTVQVAGAATTGGAGTPSTPTTPTTPGTQTAAPVNWGLLAGGGLAVAALVAGALALSR